MSQFDLIVLDHSRRDQRSLGLQVTHSHAVDCRRRLMQKDCMRTRDLPISTTAQNLDQKFEALINGECNRNLGANEIAHAKTAIEEKREKVLGMAEIFGANRGTLQSAIARSIEGAV